MRPKRTRENVRLVDFFDIIMLTFDVPQGSLGGKSRGGKEPTRQSTLFGLPLGQSVEKRGRKKKDPAEGSSQAATHAPDMNPDPSLSMASSDVTMAEPPSDATTLVETQLLEEPLETQEDTQETETQETETQETETQETETQDLDDMDEV